MCDGISNLTCKACDGRGGDVLEMNHIQLTNNDMSGKNMDSLTRLRMTPVDSNC